MEVKKEDEKVGGKKGDSGMIDQRELRGGWGVGWGGGGGVKEQGKYVNIFLKR